MKNGILRSMGACALLIFMFVACSTVISPTNGTLEGNTYKSRFFNFQVQIPQGWTIGNKRDFDQALATVKPSQKQNPNPSKEENKIEHLLLLASETPVGAPAESNPAIILAAVDLSGEPNIRNARDNERAMVRSLLETQKTWKQINDPFPVKLQSKKFYRVDIEINGLGPTMYEACFETIEKNYALILTVTANSMGDVDKIVKEACFPKNGIRS